MSLSLLGSIQSKAQLYAEDIVSMRRHLHQYPELSFQERETVRYVGQQLSALGIQTEIKAKTGLVAEIVGKKSGPVVALRADMDALPIHEANDVPYKSKNDGVMHACGHDVHTASLLGAARILNELRDNLSGTVRLIFQPGEEKTPGGASQMIEAGVLQNPVPQSIIGQHVFPLLPVGKIGFRSGKYMASCDEIYLRVIGKGGHGAMPELTVDPVVILAQIIVGLQQIVSRKAGPRQPTVLTFGKLLANGATNIIPDEATAAGTFRTFDEEWRAKGLGLIEKTAKLYAESMGGQCEVEISRGYPYLENNEALTKRLRTAAEVYVGKEHVVELEQTMGSEDFSYYSHVVPASFYRLGTRNEQKGITSYVHTPTFDIDEAALPIGSGLMAWLAVQELAAKK